MITRCDRAGEDFYIEILEKIEDDDFRIEVFRDLTKTKRIGYINSRKYEGDNYRISDFFVLPEERNKHIGHILMGTLKDMLKERTDAYKLYVFPFPNVSYKMVELNELYSIYLKLGFVYEKTITPDLKEMVIEIR